MKQLLTIVAFYMAIMCVGCGNDLQPDNVSEEETVASENVLTESVTEVFSETQEETTVVTKPVEEYKDCRGVVDPEILMDISEDGIFVHFAEGQTRNPIYDWEPPFNVKETADRAPIVVVGQVLDVKYSDQVITESGNTPTTFYSFAVSQVIKGEGILPESVITVMEFVGYMRRSVVTYSDDVDNEYPVPDDKVYYVIPHAGEPLIQTGDEYVLFIEPRETKYVDGACYVGQLFYAGKYTKNADGLYEKYIWDHGFFAPYFYQTNEETGEKIPLEPPMTLEEIINAIRE